MKIKYEFEGDIFAAEDENINVIFEDSELVDKFHSVMEYLSEKQTVLIKAIYFDGMADITQIRYSAKYQTADSDTRNSS